MPAWAITIIVVTALVTCIVFLLAARFIIRHLYHPCSFSLPLYYQQQQQQEYGAHHRVMFDQTTTTASTSKKFSSSHSSPNPSSSTVLLGAFLSTRCSTKSSTPALPIHTTSNTAAHLSLPAQPIAAASIERVVPNTARRRHLRRLPSNDLGQCRPSQDSYSVVASTTTPMRHVIHHHRHHNHNQSDITQNEYDYDYEYEYDYEQDDNDDTNNNIENNNHVVRDLGTDDNNSDVDNDNGNRMVSNFGFLRRRLTSGRYDGLTASQVSLAAVRITSSSPVSRRTSTSSVVLCTICLEEVGETDEARKLAVCGHEFHATCIGNWLRRVNKCPNCQRTALLGLIGKRSRRETDTSRRSVRARWRPSLWGRRSRNDNGNEDDVRRLKQIPDSLWKDERISCEQRRTGTDVHTDVFEGVGASGPTPLSPLDDDLVDHLLSVMQR